MKPGRGCTLRRTMPELPEVEVVRRDLEAVLRDCTFSDVVVTGLRSVRRAETPETFVHALVGRTVIAVRRHGKYLLVDLDDGHVLVVHLRMSGQLRWTPDRAAPLLAHTHVRMRPVSGGELRFVDPRTFGEMYVTTANVPELAHLGRDPWSDPLAAEDWRALLRNRRTRIKSLLMDQRVVVGIGNIYSDEVLFRMGVRGDRPATMLKKAQCIVLAEALLEVFRDAINAGGSTLSDAQYVDLYGRLGTYASHHLVYARVGEPCVQCGATVARMNIGGRYSAYCPKCQPGTRRRRQHQ
ncbi:MAG: bifunctional DNA-formamidopyrimidine glycosylase/DNA-(apurinic or apyrimidinic site) lyase [Acidimicrobiia bacterium]